MLQSIRRKRETCVTSVTGEQKPLAECGRVDEKERNSRWAKGNTQEYFKTKLICGRLVSGYSSQISLQGL